MSVRATVTASIVMAATLALAEGRLFEEMDVFALEVATEPRVSPDGSTIAYARSGFDLMKDRRRSAIWLIDSDGDNHRPMTDIGGSMPRWSPDGGRIAFLSRVEDRAQLYMHWLERNRSMALTQLTEPPRWLTWSPDGRQLAFTMLVPDDLAPLAKPPKAPEGADWASTVKVIEKLHYRTDGAGYLKPGFTHVFVVPAEGGTPRQVTRGDFNHGGGGIAWAPDGNTLYVSANRRDDWEYEGLDTEIYAVDVATREMQALTSRYGPDTNPAVSPDGRRLAYVGFDDRHQGYQIARLHLIDLRSGETSVLTGDFDRSVGNPQWDERSRALYVQYAERGMGKVDRVTLSGQRSTIVDDLGGLSLSRPYTGGSFHTARGKLAYTVANPATPADLAVPGAVLTALNADLLGHKTLARVDAFTVPSSLDGKEIHAWVAKPPGFDPAQRYPLILEIHGGPFAAYGPHFSAEVQLYAAAGYVVVYANPRGSSSYGEAFGNLIHHAYPGGDYDDLMSVVDHAIGAGWADPDRLFVTGGSGGGVLTAWIVTKTDRFRAAVSAKPVINWYSFVLTADNYSFFHRYWFADLPWNDPQSYLDRSPLHFVHNVKTPTMLLTGEEDHRTPISESEQFYQALKLNKVDTALVRVPGASHGIASRPSQQIAKVANILAWFARYDEHQQPGQEGVER